MTLANVCKARTANTRTAHRLRRLIDDDETRNCIVYLLRCAPDLPYSRPCSVRLTISTQSVVIAAKSIAKGGVISADSLALRDIPYDEALRSVAHDIDDAVGLIAQVDIAEGSIVTSAMARASPIVPKGYTAVEVRLASSADSLTIGDTVTLSSATMFSEATPETVPDMDAVSLRELCTGAILTAKPSRNADGDTLAVFAMPPHEAATVLQAQEYSAIIAIVGS